MQLYEILQHILNHHSEEECEKNDFFFKKLPHFVRKICSMNLQQ